MNPLEFLQKSAALNEKANSLHEKLQAISVEGFAGGKMVSVSLNGQLEMTAIHLDPLCVDARDVKMLEDLIVAAHHDAMQKAQEEIKKNAASLLGGISIPGLNL